MTEVERESMTSNVSQTTLLAWQQEDTRPINCDVVFIL